MAKLNNTDGFILHGWMVNELGLRGGSLSAFALIHQFSQSGAGLYKGGVPYLAAWLGCVENTARRYLQDLVDRGLVIPERGTIDGVPFCYYRVNPDTLQKLGGDPSKIAGCTPQNLGGGTPQKLRGENNNRIIKGDNNKDNAGSAFKKPTVDEVRQYCIERGNDIDPEAFVAFYESKGWKVGNSPMKDWRMAVITWEKKRRASGKPGRNREGLGDFYANLIQEMRGQYGTDADEQ